MRIPIDVWLIPLAGEATRADNELLDAAEIERAARFKFEADRRRFRRAHCAARLVLAQYTGTAPGALRFEIGAHGKPRLAGDGAPAFNLSDSEDLAVLAVRAATGFDLGVDIERRRPLPDGTALALRYCGAEEQRELRQLATTADREAAFLDCWTRKEAYVKALGTGLSEGELREMQVGLRGQVRIGRIVIDSLEVASGYAGAIACSTEIVGIRYRDFPKEFPQG